MTETTTPSKEALLDAILMHVPFDGWSEASFKAAVVDLDMDMREARALCPRGAIDLAVADHRRGDQAMLTRLAESDLSNMRFRDKVAEALWFRIEALSDREAVRRATTLFSLPGNAPEGAKLVWETSDLIWTALGDGSRDLNWYTKRATLSAVWASVLLFWLGDDSPACSETHAFIDRRIDDVMQFEKAKARFRENPLTRPAARLQDAIFGRVRAPQAGGMSDLPGQSRDPR
jgi:ubiquinone biosynthesis protein COQ9